MSKMVPDKFKCPYDGEFCVTKHQKFARFYKNVEYWASNNIDFTFTTSTDMFDGCPLSFENLSACPRQIAFVQNNQRQR